MNIRKYLYLGVGSFCAAIAFAPWYIWPASFVFLVPAILVSKSEKYSIKQTIWHGLYTGLLIDIFAYHWVVFTIQVYGHLPLVPSLLIFLLYALGSSLRYVLFFLFLRFFFHSERFNKLREKKVFLVSNPLFIIPLVWGISEFAGWQLFPYYAANLAGGNDYLIQFADITGIKGLSLIIVLINAGFALVLPDFFMRLRAKSLRQFIFPMQFRYILLLIITLLSYGFFAERYYKNTQGQQNVLIGVPQGNTPLAFQSGRNIVSELQRILHEMSGQTTEIVEQSLKEYGKKPDLIVWPESSVPFVSLQGTPFFSEGVLALIKNIQVPIIINDVYRDRFRGKDYSNMWFLSREGNPLYSYQKKYLLPFGEFMPLGDKFPALKNLFPEISDFSPGNKFEIFSDNGIRFLPLVCYEVILPGYTREFFNSTGANANILVNITNDAWFGKSIESSQHLELGRIRSIELRRPMVRATNTGITAYIDSAGNVHGKTGLFKKDSRIYQLPANTSHFTFYGFWGDIPLFIFLIVGFGGVLFSLHRFR